MKDRYSKLAFLHRVKERKTPSLSAQASFAPSSLQVAWSGKSLIGSSDGECAANLNPSPLALAKDNPWFAISNFTVPLFMDAQGQPFEINVDLWCISFAYYTIFIL